MVGHLLALHEVFGPSEAMFDGQNQLQGGQRRRRASIARRVSGTMPGMRLGDMVKDETCVQADGTVHNFYF
jgi:hypothetical protein